MLFCCCKFREWVWTKTGKGDRMGGDRRLGPSPPSERPAPPHSLYNLTDHTRGRPAHAGLLVLQFLVRIALPCLVACLIITPCLLPLICIAPVSSSSTMCARIIQCFARTALQAASPRDCIGAARALFASIISLCCASHPYISMSQRLH